ncbi:MAG: cytochrome c [Thiothrix sp.]|uniref:c-type cytochrome n=1 Tax=Thiothrix sp. TaxID=1032 RepID=UPI00260FAD3C|nr:cytochrome c [Thiothrix sp.]MDD5395439.1 cytochrome c [Thiothrix sp.]
MSRFVIVTAMALGLALGVVGSAQAADSKQVFDFYCAQCHGVNGDGKGINVTKDFATDPRNFTVTADMEKRSDEDIRGVIKDGGPSISKSPLMPPWGATLSAAEVDGLLAYIRTMCKCKGK